jgi:flagellar protein FliO/FliZ
MDTMEYLKFIFALGFVIFLLLGLSFLAKKYGLMAKVTLKRPKSGKKRLHITEILPVDAKRRLLLFRKDNKEYLVMLGTERDLLLDQNMAIPPEVLKSEEELERQKNKEKAL